MWGLIGRLSMKRWAKLTVEQLKGADYALRVLHTSPAIRGRALEILEGQMVEVVKELESRSGKEPASGTSTTDQLDGDGRFIS